MQDYSWKAIIWWKNKKLADRSLKKEKPTLSANWVMCLYLGHTVKNKIYFNKMFFEVI